MNSHHTSNRSLLRQWRRQIAGRDWQRAPSRSSRRAAIGYLPRGRVAQNLIDVRDLIIAVLHYNTNSNPIPSIRLRGSVGSQVPWGVKWGGTEGSLFDKDLSLHPSVGAGSRHLDLRRHELLALGLQLDRRLWGAPLGRKTAIPINDLRLPNLWAAFQPYFANHVYAAGPELEIICRRQRQTAAALLERYRRRHRGFVLFPLNWVSHRWKHIKAVFADLHRFPRFQIVHAHRVPENLHGFRGACEFDFRWTRLAEYGPRKRRSLRRQRIAA